MSAAAQRIRELEAAGVSISRNAHFELFRNGLNARALRLKRRLEGLGRVIRSCRAEGELDLHVQQAGGETEITVHVPKPAARITTRLTEDELSLLLREPEVGEILAAAGALPLPAGEPTPEK